MPIKIELESAVLQWQAKHNRRLTYEELAERAGISIAALYRIKSGSMITPDLRKLNALCKALECEPGDLLVRTVTGSPGEEPIFEAKYREIKQEIEKPKQAKQS